MALKPATSQALSWSWRSFGDYLNQMEGRLGVNVGGTAQGSQLEAAAAAHLCASLTNHVFASEFLMGLSAIE